MHILEALITAINNIDEVIQIIKSSENTEDAKLKLEKRFNFDDEQAQAIVDMQLKRLTHLLIEDLQKEIKELNKKKLEAARRADAEKYGEEYIESPDDDDDL